MKKEERNDDLEFIGALARDYFGVIAKRNPDDYKINSIQLEHYKNIIECLAILANKMPGENNAEFECELIPVMETGGITMRAYMLDVTSGDLRVLADVLDHASSPLTIEATTDGRICLSVTVPGIHKKKGGDSM